jgi:hypothetical protein
VSFQEYFFILVYREQQRIFSSLDMPCGGLWQIDFNALHHHRGGDHKND